MRYELLFQSVTPGAPYESAKVDRALADRGATETPQGRVWQLKSGRVEVKMLVEAGKTVATELEVPLSDKLDLIREVVVEGSALAEQAGVLLFDPQLVKGLSARDEGRVAEQFLRTARYAGEMMGVPEALAASYTGEDPTALKPGTKALLWLGAILVGLYLLAEKVLG